MKTYKYVLVVLVFLVFGFIIYFKYETSINRRISKELDIEIPYNVELKYTDSHGGFHGDGILFAKAQFNEKSLDKIKSNIANTWNKAPFTEDIKILLYGNRNYSSNLGERLGLPKTYNGYWVFIDRHGGNIRKKNGGEKVFSRASANYSFAVFDIDNKILYYLEYDS